ncbi:MAG: nuclease [Betaproteobacteria bacterium]|nr:nuclease [Betaproteobacteria bacterium]
MSLVIFLDSGPLGLVTNPNANENTKACARWLIACLDAGARVCLPEICDYEVRRELVRASKVEGLTRLDEFKNKVEYVPIDTAMMQKAAEFWAQARNAHRPTAPDEALDADVILAAQAMLSVHAGEELVIATTNVGHLAQFAAAKRWNEITAA